MRKSQKTQQKNEWDAWTGYSQQQHPNNHKQGTCSALATGTHKARPLCYGEANKKWHRPKLAGMRSPSWHTYFTKHQGFLLRGDGLIPCIPETTFLGRQIVEKSHMCAHRHKKEIPTNSRMGALWQLIKFQRAIKMNWGLVHKLPGLNLTDPMVN